MDYVQVRGLEASNVNKTYSTEDSVQVVQMKTLKPCYSVHNVHNGIFGVAHICRDYCL